MEKERHLEMAKNPSFAGFRQWVLRNFPRTENHYFAMFEDLLEKDNLPAGKDKFDDGVNGRYKEVKTDEKGNPAQIEYREYGKGHLISLDFDVYSGNYYAFTRQT